MEILVSNTPDIDAGHALSATLNKYADIPVLLMLSGGSALSLLAHVDVSVLNSRITITTLDERFSTDPQINNFSQIEQTSFFTEAINRGVKTISTKIDATDTLQSAGNQFEKQLQNWRSQNSDGVIVATMGIGADGHTAGIFPDVHGVNFDGDSWVVGYVVPKEVNPYTERITVTNTFLREHVHEVIVYAKSGEAEILKSLEQSDCDPQHKPACIIRKLTKATLYTDYSFRT